MNKSRFSSNYVNDEDSNNLKDKTKLNFSNGLNLETKNFQT